MSLSILAIPYFLFNSKILLIYIDCILNINYLNISRMTSTGFFFSVTELSFTIGSLLFLQIQHLIKMRHASEQFNVHVCIHVSSSMKQVTYKEA